MKKYCSVLFAIIMFTMLCTGCGTMEEDNGHEQQLIENINGLEVESEVAVELSELTPFEWEKVYIFKPYTSKESIKEVTGCKIKDFYYSVSDSDTQIYFVKSGEVVCSLIGKYETLQFRVDYNFDDIYYQLGEDETIKMVNEEGVRVLKVIQ